MYTKEAHEGDIQRSLRGRVPRVLYRRRYELYIIGEHEFRVEHSLLALPGVKKEDIKRVMSHPQALAQCDNYLRNMGWVGRCSDLCLPAAGRGLTWSVPR